MITRRAFLSTSTTVAAATIGSLPIGSSHAEAKASAVLLAKVDHLIYATPDLNLGIAALEKLLGVRATAGGQHLGRGTRNALIALGPSVYLEILGPDPDQPKPAHARWFGIDDLEAPRLAAWSAKATNLDKFASEAAKRGVNLGAVSSGSRQRPDGVTLTWRFTDPFTVVADRIVPFFIDWGQSPHPALSAAKGCTLIDFRAEHPEPNQVQQMLQQLGLDLPVQAAARPALVGLIAGVHGEVELR